MNYKISNSLYTISIKSILVLGIIFLLSKFSINPFFFGLMSLFLAVFIILIPRHELEVSQNKFIFKEIVFFYVKKKDIFKIKDVNKIEFKRPEYSVINLFIPFLSSSDFKTMDVYLRNGNIKEVIVSFKTKEIYKAIGIIHDNIKIGNMNQPDAVSDQLDIKINR